MLQPSTTVTESHERAPSALNFMARAFLPSPGLPRDGGLPPIVERWSGLRIEPRHLEAFCDATATRATEGVSVLYPHVLGFRLQMALLTHRAFPLPIWRALQIRNRLIRHRRIDLDDALDLETRTDSCRRVDKGLEVDLQSRLLQRSECVWESTITYFYRGKFDSVSTVGPSPAAPSLSGAGELARFEMPADGGWRFGALTGDYNGIHWSSGYARRFGFRAPFLHPQRAVGLCLARLRAPESEAQCLDVWIKGPLFYRAGVSLNAEQGDSRVNFGLSLVDDSRMALAGSWAKLEGNPVRA